jgi:polyhydroxybutyrate depolymerase
VQRAQAGHPLLGEIGAQPLSARSRKQLDKGRYGLSCLAGRRSAHDSILPDLTLTSTLPILSAMRDMGQHARQRGPAAVMGAWAVLIMITLAGCGAVARSSASQSDPRGAGQAIPIGSSSHAIDVGGVRRTFIVYRPASLPAAAPLVVMLHGGFGSGSQAEKSYGWDAEADSGHFVVAYPDGLNRAWNTGGGCCGTPGRTNVDDIGFITAMVSAIEHQIPVNANRVYATGISNGGIMAYTLACHTTIFAAIGPDSATELGSCPVPAPLSVIHIHGTADKNIPYQGGEGDGVAHIDGPAIPALNATWRGIDHCAAPVITTAGVVTTSTATCPAGRTVELITIAGAGHQWPGAIPDRLAQILLHTDPPSTALNATQVIWQFFAAHAR